MNNNEPRVYIQKCGRISESAIRDKSVTQFWFFRYRLELGHALEEGVYKFAIIQLNKNGKAIL